MGRGLWWQTGDGGAAGGRGAGRVWAGLIILLLIGFATRTAGAQAIKGRIVSIGIGENGGLYRPGSWVPVQVRLENRSGRDFEGRLAVERPDLDGDRVTTLGRKFVLLATERNDQPFWAYYWPSPDDDLHGLNSVLVLNGGNVPVANITTPDGRLTEGGIAPADVTGRSSRHVVVMGKQMGWSSFRDAWGGTEGVRFAQVGDARQLPDDVKGFDSVDVIVWQADEVKVSDIPPDFQLKAMVEWVKAGGHLVVSVATQGQEFAKAPPALADVMPVQFTGTRSLAMEALAVVHGCEHFGGAAPGAGNQVPFVQATGALRPGARAVSGGDAGEFAAHPLMVTGLCGRGAITVLTMNAGHPEMERSLDERKWMFFWNQVLGWQSQNPPVTAAEVAAKGDMVTMPRPIVLANDVSGQIDVTEATQSFVLVAVMFLAMYWLLAGPVGHLVLRHYKVVHWSWWIFGATVTVAIVVAGVMVVGLRLRSTDVRHRSFVLGTVNSPDVTVLGFYGVYAAASGPLEIAQPDSAGMNYLMPLAVPTAQAAAMKTFADVQGYDAAVERANVIAPIFRQTLKKMEGRWTGQRPGIEGAATFVPEKKLQELQGELVNNSGYDLEGVQIIVYRPAGDTSSTRIGSSHLYTCPAWKNGQRINLQTDIAIDPLGAPAGGANTVEKLLQVTGWKLGDKGTMGGALSARDFLNPAEGPLFSRALNDELLHVLLDLRKPDFLKDSTPYLHFEPVRGIARLLDSTKALHAAGALIVAHAGSVARKEFVDAPVPLTVGGSRVNAKGDVLFVWALPVAGDMTIQPGEAAPAEGRGGLIDNGGLPPGRNPRTLTPRPEAP